MRNTIPKDVLEAERFYLWFRWRWQTLGISKNRMNDEICERLHIARRDLFEASNIELESAYARGVALGDLEKWLGVDERDLANGLIALLAAGAYIDWAVVLGTIMQDESLEDPDIDSPYSPLRVTAANLAELKEHFSLGVAPGGFRVYVAPDVNRYLFDPKLSQGLWIQDLHTFNNAFHKWNSTRRRADIPHSTQVAVHAFAARDIPAGLALLSEAGKAYRESFETPKRIVDWMLSTSD